MSRPVPIFANVDQPLSPDATRAPRYLQVEVFCKYMYSFNFQVHVDLWPRQPSPTPLQLFSKNYYM